MVLEVNIVIVWIEGHRAQLSESPFRQKNIEHSSLCAAKAQGSEKMARNLESHPKEVPIPPDLLCHF